MSHVFHGTLITLMRRGSSLINPELTAEDSTTTTATATSEPISAVERHWKTWIKTEATIRTAFFAFIVDIQHAEMFGHTPALYANELSLDLPCDDELWNASDAERWGMLMKSSARSSGGRKRTSFFSSLKLVMSHGWNRLRLNPFGRYIVLHGLLSISWTMRQRGIISIGISSKEKKDMSEAASPRGSPPPPQQQQQQGSGAETGTRQGGLIAQAVNRAASVAAASSPADAMKEGGSNNANGEGTEAAGSPAAAGGGAAAAATTAGAAAVSTTAGDWTSVIYKAFETWKLAFDLSESENPSASGIPFILASSSLHRLGIIRLYTDVLQLHVYAGLSHVLGRPIRAQDWLRAEDAMKAWARSPGSYLSVWHASRLVSGAFLGQAGQYSADNDVVLHRPWCLYLGCLVLWAYGYAMEDCSRKYSDYVAVKAAAEEEEGEEGERRGNSGGSSSYHRFGKFPTGKRSRPSSESTAAAAAAAPEFIHTTTPSWNAREDMERYLESLLAVSEPADIPKLATKNCTIGLMAYAGELFRSCRWTLLGEEAAYHCSRLACAIPVRS
ncbi:fungal-specific transcription factor domain-containing protein [Myxozyma melibiosi]|uniref:Fungal-specific transcription factor domain-containing protein n=1 Tax=Myxozyma melibiosi TaxID=54550 RepID=A0ABR1F4V8_9ASCO